MHKSYLAAAVSTIAICLATIAHGQALSPDDAAKAIVDQMSRDEQLALVKSRFPAFEKDRAPDAIISAGYVPGNARLGLPSLRESDAGMGVANLLNLRKDDVATSLPSGLAVAASWNPHIAYQGGAMIGSEARSKGFNVLLAGGVNLVRDPQNGRNFEYPGEDPLLAGIIAGSSVKGVQSNHILSTVKHYTLNAQETGRNVLNARIDEASLRESDLLAFQIAIETGDPASVMCGYNKINGDYACENDFLLNKVLRHDWSYKGWVMSDWGSVHSTTKAALAGLDHQSGFKLDPKPWFGDLLNAAIDNGEVPATRLKEMSYRIVRSMYATGLMSDPVPDTPQPIDYKAHGLISQAAAEASIVLLQNQRRILPLVADGKTIAVIGGHADIGVLSGGGSSQVRPVGGPALELKPTGMSQAFARITYFPSSPLTALRERFPNGNFTFANGDDIETAAKLAAASDIVIIFADQWTTESEDVPNLNLPGKQDALIEAVARANKRVVVVLETGGPVVMPWRDKVAGIVEAWYPGSNGGQAIARVLAGDVDAAGRLPVTFPTAVSQLPRPNVVGMSEKTNSKGVVTYGLAAGQKTFDVEYTEGADIGYRWFQRKGLKPLFPFGHGLSYTRFGYSGLQSTAMKPLEISFKVKNTGDRQGIDTPQVYVTVPGRDGTSGNRLVGWGRVSLSSGQSETVTVTIDPRLLANFDVDSQKWRVKAGTYRVHLGKSSAALVSSTALTLSDMTLEP